MEVRQLHRLPEIHYDFRDDSRGVPIAPYGDEAVAPYAQELGVPSGAYLVRYESMQPPLFYLVAGLIASPFPSDPRTVLYISKLVAALFGAGTVYLIWASIRQIAPAEPKLALLSAGCVALLPEFAYISSSASNDSALYMLGAALFYVWFRGLREIRYDPYLLKAGVIMGLGIITKLTMLALVPAFGLVILLHALDGSHRWAARLGRLVILSVAPWVLRSLFAGGGWCAT
jgi:4-amino-4-deoxy-L-arabinose transferase-like glycosyltransferase